MKSSTLFSLLIILGIIAFVYIEITRKIQQDRLLRQHWREEKKEMWHELKKEKKEDKAERMKQKQQMFNEIQAVKDQRFQERMAEREHRDAVILSAMATRPYGNRHHRRHPHRRHRALRHHR
jgi:hypothetical protein